MQNSGKLSVVATPIGNREDLSPRAQRTLTEADLILCEDTRTTRKLLTPLGIDKPLSAYHEHNEQRVAADLATQIAGGKHLALVSDAGTPGISDPGFRLVRECHRRGLAVETIPGPVAFVAALAASGLPTDSFFYKGFLPPKSAARRKFFADFGSLPCTLCLYESNHRIVKFLHDCEEVLGGHRVICVAKELTKIHETILTAPVGELVRQTASGGPLFAKGEFVVLIAPPDFVL